MAADIRSLALAPRRRPATKEQALVAALDAVQALVDARDEAVRALDELADAFVASLDGATTFAEESRKPMAEILGWYYPETFALWATVREHRDFIAEDGNGSGFDFDFLIETATPEITAAFHAWVEKEQGGRNGS
jgi:hypothetical protein